MATYEYIAKTTEGKNITGVMQAESETAVARTLDERRLFPIRVSEQAPVRKGMHQRKIRVRDIGVFYGQLADLLRAGVPMMRALETLQRSVTSAAFGHVLAAVRDGVAAGKTLAEAMAEHPKVFTGLHTAMIKAGEHAGFLEDVLTNLADFLERQDELRSKVRGALIYPVLLTIIGTLMIIGVLVLLVPNFKHFFDAKELPVPTALLFALSDLLTRYIWMLAGFVVLGVLGVRAALMSERGRRVWDLWRLKLPLAGKAIRMVAITRFCRILGTMLANGVPILQALAIAKDAAGSVPLSEAISAAAENVRAGEPLAAPLKDSGLFPPEIIEMVAVAEESNQLEKVLVQIADTVERRTNRQVDQAVRLIEPLILVALATTIGFVAVGLLYPIFTMSQVIGGR